MSVARAIAGTAPRPRTVTLPSGAAVLRRSDAWPGRARRDPTRNRDERDREQAPARSVRYRSSSVGSQVEPHGSVGDPAKARLTTRPPHAIRSRARGRLLLRQLEPERRRGGQRACDRDRGIKVVSQRPALATPDGRLRAHVEAFAAEKLVIEASVRLAAIHATDGELARSRGVPMAAIASWAFGRAS